MQSTYEARSGEQTEIQRQIRQGDGKIVSYPFGPVCKLLWPFKTAAQLAAIAGTNERTAARWLSGEFEPPTIVVLAVINKIFAR